MRCIAAFFLLFVGLVVFRALRKCGWFGHGGSYRYDGQDGADCDEYADYELNAALGDRNYFSGESAEDYDTYYAQTADDALMGDEGAIEEMRGEYGDDWRENF